MGITKEKIIDILSMPFIPGEECPWKIIQNAISEQELTQEEFDNIVNFLQADTKKMPKQHGKLYNQTSIKSQNK